MAQDVRPVIEAISGPLEARGILVEDVRAVEAGVHRTLTVVIDLAADTSDPVSLDHIAEATRIVSEVLDPLPLFKDRPYNLEVTSPGADRPLTEPRHFRRVRGRTIAVRTARDKHQGELIDVDDSAITLRDAKSQQDLRIELADVEHAEVELRFR